jgi:hypothetical protein
MIRLAVIAVLHVAALTGDFLIEYELYHITLAALAWLFVNCIFLIFLRRPIVSAALSLALLYGIVEMSLFKWNITYMTATFLDALIIDSDTFAFLIQIFPRLKWWLLGGAVAGIPLLFLLWRFDRFRVPRLVSFGVGALCLVLIIPMSLAKPEEGWEPFQGVNHISNFARSAVAAVSQLTATGWLDAAAHVSNPVPMVSDAPCKPERELPNIIVVLDESSFDISGAPGIKVPEGYERHFQSFDGKKRLLEVESTGGPTWYSEYNLLTGLSARSYGKLKYYLTRISAERITRGLPTALKKCGYDTYSLYPAQGDFLSARRFQTALGVDHFIDQNAMGADVEMNPDSFFYDRTVKLFEKEQGNKPLFVFTYLTANHFPWTVGYHTDLTPDWKAPGNTPEIDEYLRRQTMSAADYRDFTARLKREFPDRKFLILRFGDHQPAISNKILEPNADTRSVAKKMEDYDPLYFTTYYVIDTVNFTPTDLSSARERLEGAYMPLLLQELAGVPLDPSFVEQKKIFGRCAGKFYACKGGDEARWFNRLLMDAGLIKGL